jgi:hypothetical protein
MRAGVVMIHLDAAHRPQFPGPAHSPDLPDGLFGDPRVQSLLQKYSASRLTQITSISAAVPLPRGALAIVTDVGRDAVDADAPITNGADADGEVVWS